MTTAPELRKWIPRLFGIERSIHLLPGDRSIVRAGPDATHAALLAREATTASVLYVRFVFTTEQIGQFASAPVVLLVDHPRYRYLTNLSEPTRTSRLEDLGDA